MVRAWNILAMDASTFRAWARLIHRRPDELIEHAMIAATASVRELTVVTRSIKDFAELGVPTLDPFEARG